MSAKDGYAVLMSVYAKEQPDFFRAALCAAMAQSLPPEEIVLVCDGPLTEALEAVIAKTAAEAGEKLKLVRLSENSGLGPALNAGLRACGCEYVARMDTDDISCPDRCARQLAYMRENGLDLCSGSVAEFEKGPRSITAYRHLPKAHDALIQYAKRRNPMNHPCVMFRKTAVDAAGGYRRMPLFEDYDLWVRMIQSGARLGNCQEVLTHMRAGENMMRRRGGRAYCRHICGFYKSLLKSGFISGLEYAQNIVLRCAVSLLPNGARALFYRRALRSRSEDGKR